MHVLESAWESLRREFDVACAESSQTARLATAHELNQLLRRLRQYQSEAEWVASVLSGVGKFTGQFALFFLQGGELRLRGQQWMDLPGDLSFPLASAAAFASAAGTKDLVVALRTTAEVGPLLSSQNQPERAYLFPITNESRVAAILFAPDDGQTDPHALELVASLGSLVLKHETNSTLHTQIAPAFFADPIAPNGNSKRATFMLPAWADLDERQRTLHIRAQRFSRVTVAEMQLFRPEACRAGRDQANLYIFLKSELDKARETYRKQFMTIPSMVDYLHLELVRTIAEGDEIKLGADYPGQLV